MPPQRTGFLGTSVFSGTGDPLSEKWKEEWWARFPDRHAQLNTFECALFVLVGSYLYFSPEQFEPTVTFFNSHTGSLPSSRAWWAGPCCPPLCHCWSPWLGRRDFGQCKAPTAGTGGKTLSWMWDIHRLWDLCMQQQGEGLSAYQRLLAECVLGCADSDQDFHRKLLSHLKSARLCMWSFASDYSKHQ